MDETVDKFVALAAKSLTDETFIKLVLSNYKGDDRSLQKISVRRIDTKQGRRMMFQSRFEMRDLVKNFDIPDAIDEILSHLRSGFRNAHLFTTAADLQLTIGKRKARLTTGKPTTSSHPSKAHDREKRSIIDPNAYYLKALGIADDNGRIKPSQQDKWRQINKFVEIIAGLVDASPIRNTKDLKIVDMGSGKGYLTFAAYDFLRKPAQSKGDGAAGTTSEPTPRQIQMLGIESRAELVATCNEIARAGGFDGLRFVQGQIADVEPGEIDILIALHACDTATDDALFRGILAKASIIIAAPCCHKELRKQIKPPEMLAGVLKHGVMLERTSETITDGLRALLLEREGYKTKLFEFVPTEHTPKNNMLAATLRTSKNARNEAARQVEDLMSTFGIDSQRLSDLLN